MQANRMQQRSGIYECQCCKRKTRATGRGDNEHAQLCAECFDLAGEENHLTDNGTFYSGAAEVLRLVEAVAEKGGHPGTWAHLYNTAMEQATK